MSERDSYPFWVAMGAAVVGTMLGGGAVWLGTQARLDAVERSLEQARVAPPVEVVEPAPEPVPVIEPPPVPSDPGESALVRAIERTRGSVVSIALAGSPAGAGVVYDEGGALLTNYHVIEPLLRAQLAPGDPEVNALTVRFADGRERGARVLAADPDEDVAILSLIREREGERFDVPPLGYSSELRLGEQVFAIGSPVGFEGTVATGIISSLERTGVLANRQLAVLQLDAAINFGNSGGPLFNLEGELVGITTARSRRGEGIGFAIPIDHVRLFLRALETGMHGRSGMIGVVLDLDERLLAKIGPLGYHSGVLVSAVDEGAAAAKAGMRAGDVIVSVRGRRRDELDASGPGQDEFRRLLGETIRALLPGESLAVEVVRDGELLALELVVEAASVERQARIDAEELLGLYLEQDGEAAKVAGLIPGSPIDRMRGRELLIGATLTSVFGHEVAGVEELGERLALLRSWTAGGGRRSISIGFETADGRPMRANNFPLVPTRGSR